MTVKITAKKLPKRPRHAQPWALGFVIRGLKLESPLNGGMGTSRAWMFARAGKRRTQRLAARLHTQALMVKYAIKGPIAVPVTITITRIAPCALDGDNLQGAAKSVRDGIADALGVDDRCPLLTWLYGQRKGAVREYGVHVDLVAS